MRGCVNYSINQEEIPNIENCQENLIYFCIEILSHNKPLVKSKETVTQVYYCYDGIKVLSDKEHFIGAVNKGCKLTEPIKVHEKRHDLEVCEGCWKMCKMCINLSSFKLLVTHLYCVFKICYNINLHVCEAFK